MIISLQKEAELSEAYTSTLTSGRVEKNLDLLKYRIFSLYIIRKFQ